ncbi:MAG TPA: hypothetical protein VKS44_08000 [Candidatus Acidoferrales bacterium]|nr:hypothetical protein [Candidatus Acidoferrales bacterium]
MAQTFLVFDFGTNEEAAQQARHKFEGWKQAFRLGDKVALKFERTADEEGEETSAESKSDEGKSAPSTKRKSGSAAKKTAKKKSPEGEDEKGGPEKSSVRILIRLSFSDHEKLSLQRWLDRIPSEEPFKTAKGETVRYSDPSFAKTAELFDSLD